MVLVKMQDTKTEIYTRWNLERWKEHAEVFVLVFFLKNLTKGPKKPIEKLRSYDARNALNSYRLTPALSQSWSKITIIIIIIVICYLSIGYYLQEQEQIQPLLRLRGNNGVKRISSVVSDSAWSVTVVHFVFFCRRREKHREGKAPKHECVDRKFLPRSALLRRAPLNVTSKTFRKRTNYT